MITLFFSNKLYYYSYILLYLILLNDLGSFDLFRSHAMSYKNRVKIND